MHGTSTGARTVAFASIGERTVAFESMEAYNLFRMAKHSSKVLAHLQIAPDALPKLSWTTIAPPPFGADLLVTTQPRAPSPPMVPIFHHRTIEIQSRCAACNPPPVEAVHEHFARVLVFAGPDGDYRLALLGENAAARHAEATSYKVLWDLLPFPVQDQCGPRLLACVTDYAQVIKEMEGVHGIVVHMLGMDPMFIKANRAYPEVAEPKRKHME